MRKDIAKVVVTRARRGGHRGRKRTFKGAFEDLPNKISMSPKRNFSDWKELTDFLAPLKGFLEKAVGRPWDDIYSEIREHLSPNSTMHMHVLEHVEGFVETRPYVLDGKYYQQPRWHNRLIPVSGLYVDIAGILRKAVEKKYEYPKYNIWKVRRNSTSFWQQGYVTIDTANVVYQNLRALGLCPENSNEVPPGFKISHYYLRYRRDDKYLDTRMLVSDLQALKTHWFWKRTTPSKILDDLIAECQPWTLYEEIRTEYRKPVYRYDFKAKEHNVVGYENAVEITYKTSSATEKDLKYIRKQCALGPNHTGVR